MGALQGANGFNDFSGFTMHPVKANSSALRRGRVSQVGGIYQISTVTFERKPVFADFDMARIAISELRACDDTKRCKTLAYVLMPDHLHWLVTLKQADLSTLVWHYKARAAGAGNRKHGTRTPSRLAPLPHTVGTAPCGSPGRGEKAFAANAAPTGVHGQIHGGFPDRQEKGVGHSDCLPEDIKMSNHCPLRTRRA